MTKEMGREEKKENGTLTEALLDSSLIRQTNNKKQYNLKLINCNGFIHLYFYETMRIKKDNNLEDSISKNKDRGVVEQMMGIETDNTPTVKELKEIRMDNAFRSKFALQRLIKANASEFKTLITLTFAENLSSIDKANKYFNIWRLRAKKIFPNLKYVCVPEYQKRGTVHYHLVSNIPINSYLITLQSEKENQYDVRYWPDGFTSVFEIKDINIVSYMSKYMTKGIDNRLFSRKRYFYSKSLVVPKQSYFDIEDEQATKYVHNILLNKKKNYHNIYYNKLTNREIEFYELTSYNIYYVKFYIANYKPKYIKTLLITVYFPLTLLI